MYTTRAGKDVLEAQRVHKCWPLLMSVMLVGLFLSRAIYNIVAVRVGDIQIFGDGSTFATDMVGLLCTNMTLHLSEVSRLLRVMTIPAHYDS